MNNKLNNALSEIDDNLIEEAAYASGIEHKGLKTARNIALSVCGAAAAAAAIFFGVNQLGGSQEKVDLLLSGSYSQADMTQNGTAADCIAFHITPSLEEDEKVIMHLNTVARTSKGFSTKESMEWYRISPEDISEAYGITVYKDISGNCGALEYEGKYYAIGEFSGGLGVYSFAVADLNGDGMVELYYTFSWESGNQIGYFDTATQSDTRLPFAYFSELELIAENGDLSVYTAETDVIASSVDIDLTSVAKVGDIVFRTNSNTITVVAYTETLEENCMVFAQANDNFKVYLKSDIDNEGNWSSVAIMNKASAHQLFNAELSFDPDNPDTLTLTVYSQDAAQHEDLTITFEFTHISGNVWELVSDCQYTILYIYERNGIQSHSYSQDSFTLFAGTRFTIYGSAFEELLEECGIDPEEYSRQTTNADEIESNYTVYSLVNAEDYNSAVLKLCVKETEHSEPSVSGSAIMTTEDYSQLYFGTFRISPSVFTVEDGFIEDPDGEMTICVEHSGLKLGEAVTNTYVLAKTDRSYAWALTSDSVFYLTDENGEYYEVTLPKGAIFSTTGEYEELCTLPAADTEQIEEQLAELHESWAELLSEIDDPNFSLSCRN